MTPPLPAGHNGDGRTPGGRFAAGNKAGRGNPLNRRAQLLRNVGLRAVSTKDMAAIFQKAVEQAKAGDAQARAWVADRLIGKASEQTVIERVEKLEQAVAEQERNEQERQRRDQSAGTFADRLQRKQA